MIGTHLVIFPLLSESFFAMEIKWTILIGTQNAEQRKTQNVSESFFMVFPLFKRTFPPVVIRTVMNQNKDNVEPVIKDDSPIGELTEDLLIEIFIRVPISEWEHIACVRKQWANLFRGECLWQAALNRAYPLSSKTKKWIGPIRQGLSKRLVTDNILPNVVYSLIQET